MTLFTDKIKLGFMAVREQPRFLHKAEAAVYICDLLILNPSGFAACDLTDRVLEWQGREVIISDTVLYEVIEFLGLEGVTDSHEAKPQGRDGRGRPRRIYTLADEKLAFKIVALSQEPRNA